jgi:hypothetical protein
MKKTLLLAAALSLAAMPALAQGWRSGFGQGINEISVGNGPGNEFRINCDVGITDDASRTSVSFTIRDRYPRKGSKVAVYIDDTELEFYMDDDYRSLISYRAAQGNFDMLWEKARTGRSMRVVFEDGRTSTFSLKGAAKALGRKPCDTGFTGR